MSRFKNEVIQVRQKREKREGSNKTDSHKLNKRHMQDKRKPLPKGPKYERYTPLTTNHTTILEEAFNLEVPIRLPLTKPPGPGLGATKYYRYHHGIGHNTEHYWALKDNIEKLIQTGT